MWLLNRISQWENSQLRFTKTRGVLPWREAWAVATLEPRGPSQHCNWPVAALQLARFLLNYTAA